jgi:hypothetical protein
MAAVASAVYDPRAAARALLRRLAEFQEPSGNLRDPLTGEPLAPPHYAVSLFAGSGAISGEADLQAPAERAVRYFLGLLSSVRGAHELNNLGLLAAYRAWAMQGRSEGLRKRLRDYLVRMPFASLEGRATNNWHAMRAVCLLQRGLTLDRSADVEAGVRCLRRDVLPLQDEVGLFADYPPGGGRRRCTPLTYHAKFCAMLAMFLSDLHDEGAAEALRKGVVALARLCAPDGETLYFGRSCNSLYGYAAHLYAMGHALRLGVVEGDERAAVAWAAERVQEFLARLASPDGCFRTYPTPFERERLGWDDYVDRLDYAAFAAFLMIQTPPVSGGCAAHQLRRWEAPAAGLWAEGDSHRFAAFATRGQFHPGSYLFVDGRSSGIQVLTWKDAGRTVVPPPPHEMSDPADPGWVGFMPVVQASGQAWAVRTYDEVRSFPSPAGVAFVGRGAPISLHATATHRAARRAEGNLWLGWALRGFRGVARRLRVQPPGAYREVALAGAEVRRALVWFREDGCLVAVDRFNGQAEAAWGTVRLSVPTVPTDGILRFDHRGLRGRVRFLFGVAAPPEVKEVFTSNGLGYVVRYPLHAGSPAVTAVALGEVDPWCAATGSTVQVRVGDHAAVVDLERLEVRWWSAS